MSPRPAALPALTPQTRRTVSSLPRAGVQARICRGNRRTPAGSECGLASVCCLGSSPCRDGGREGGGAEPTGTPIIHPVATRRTGPGSRADGSSRGDLIYLNNSLRKRGEAPHCVDGDTEAPRSSDSAPVRSLACQGWSGAQEGRGCAGKGGQSPTPCPTPGSVSPQTLEVPSY